MNRFGLSLIIPSLNTGALRSLQPDQVGQGAGMVNFVRTLGGAAGVNLMVVFLEGATANHTQTIVSSQTPDNSASRELLRQTEQLMRDAGVSATDAAAGALQYLGQTVYAQGLTQGFQDTFMLTAFIAAAAIIPAYVMGRDARRGR